MAAAVAVWSGCGAHAPALAQAAAQAATQAETRAEAGCKPNPLPGVMLFLRGGMNSWAPVDEYAFRYLCDAHYLNVDLQGLQAFKIADADWTAAANFGEGAEGELVLGGGNAARRFDGEHTLRLTVRGASATLEIGPKRLPDPQVAQVTDPIALGLAFDSQVLAHKAPFGAVPQRSLIHYAVHAPVGVRRLTLVIERRDLQGNQERLRYTEIARVPMRAQPARRGQVSWRASHRFDEQGVFGYWFEADIGSGRYVVQNNRVSVHWTRERGAGGAATVAAMPESRRSIRRFRQTVYDPAFAVPAWAKDAIYYQIFAERFRNGDPANDPVVGRDRYRDRGIEKHADWLDRPFRPGSGDGSDDVYNNDFFGGDLAGIIDKLDQLQDLGVNVLYLTPVFQAPSNHKYDTADYRRIDPAFGSESDFVQLTREAARRGMRILPDASFNHVGSDSPYFDRYGNHAEVGAFEGGRPNPASPYASWFRFDTTQTDPDRQYAHWGGPDLPEIDEGSRAFRDFAFGAPDAVTRYWLDRGAAGWRMDVAPWVGDDFWREWRLAVKQHRPDALTLAETWFDASKYLVGDMFDATMNYIFRNAVLDYAAGGKAQDLAVQLEHLREAYPPQALSALMNLVSSHDVARALHVLGWHDEPVDSPKARLAKRRLQLATFIQMTQPGAPHVYYGDEVGLTGGEDPYNRAGYPWRDAGGRPDLQLRSAFRRLIALRREHPILRHGRAEGMRALDAHLTLTTRSLGRQRAWVLTNNASTARTVTLRDPRLVSAAHVRDALTGEALPARDAQLTIAVPPWSGRVLLTVAR